MAENAFFGIDTSNYTTSCAVVTANGEIFSEKRHLAVPEGSGGTRQSDALFCHTRDLPEISASVMAKAKTAHPELEIKGIGVSVTPRREKGSYMPCFLAGVNAAKVMGNVFSVPVFEFSHQEGHIRAAMEGTKTFGKEFPETECFFALHLSGGTGELLRTTRENRRFKTEIISRTLDITFGQFIDRCGVKMGMKFPCGRELDSFAKKSDSERKIRIPKKENGINLSGFENKFDEILKKETDKNFLCSFVFDVVLNGINELLNFIPENEKSFPVLFSGGVASSEYLRKKLAGDNHFFAPAEFSADNAVGTALLARDNGGQK